MAVCFVINVELKLPRSDRKVPPWVLSSTILFRLQKLLDQLERGFEYTEADLSAPGSGKLDGVYYCQAAPCKFFQRSLPVSRFSYR
jgi:hypothetical protein